MKLKIAALIAVVGLAAAPLAAQAEAFTIELAGLDLSSAAGLKDAERQVQAAADSLCGPQMALDPAALRASRIACRADVVKAGMATVQAKQAQVLAAQQLASR